MGNMKNYVIVFLAIASSYFLIVNSCAQAATPTPTPSVTPTPTPSMTPTPTRTPSPSPTPSVTPTPVNYVCSLDLEYSTYLGGSSDDYGRAIAVDSLGFAYICGETCSSDFPTENPYQGTCAGDSDAFVSKLSSTGTSLIYSTYLGGGYDDWGYGIALSDDSAYLTGSTKSIDFPTENPYQGTCAGSSDAFVSKLSSTGTSLIYSTYLGGVYDDWGYGIAISGDSAYLTGWTDSFNFPKENPYQGTKAGAYDVFVSKLSSSGSSLVYSTYLGGISFDFGRGIALSGD